MANLSDSYDKAVLVFSLVVALGLGAAVFLAKGKVEEDFADSPSGRRADVPKNPNAGKDDLYGKAIEAIDEEVVLEAPVTEGGRKIQNFVGTPLFMVAGKDDPVDLGDKSYPPVHPPIPNSWWLKHDVDPDWSDSPDRDADGDGFTNLDEFTGETDPNDPKSFPALIAKLTCVRLEKRVFRITYSSDTTLGAIKAGDKFKFKHEEVVGGRRVSTTSEWIQPGQASDSNVFGKGGAQLRYELKSVEQKQEQNPRNGLMEKFNVATIEDVGGPKKGDVIELKKGSANGLIIRDWTAILVLAAVGEEGNELKVAERESFALPLDPNAAEKPYMFAAVSDRGAAIIEWKENGETKSRELIPAATAE